MKFIRIVPALVFALGLSAFAQESSSEAPLSKEERIKALRKALGSGGGGGESSASAKSKKSKEPIAPPDYRQRAFDELRPKETAYSANPHPVLATVSTQEIEAKDPVLYQGLQIGLTAQPYEAQGSVNLVTLGKRDFGSLPTTVMAGVELRYMPFTTEWLGHHAWGFRSSVSYAGQNVALKGATGKDLGSTKLHSILTAVYLGQEWSFKRNPAWSWTLDAGGAHFDMIQSGESNLAQASAGEWLAMLRTGPSYRMGPVWVNLAYERRIEVSRSSWASLGENSVILGVQYGVR